MPVMLSTRKDWFSAPRLNFSLRRRRKTGVTNGRNRDIERERGNNDPCQRHRIIGHDAEKDEGEEQIDHQASAPNWSGSCGCFQARAHARHCRPPPCFEIGDRQRDQMLEQPRPQLDIDAVGGMREHIGTQSRKQAFKEGNHHQAKDRTFSVDMPRCTSTLSITT